MLDRFKSSAQLLNAMIDVVSNEPDTVFDDDNISTTARSNDIRRPRKPWPMMNRERKLLTKSVWLIIL